MGGRGKMYMPNRSQASCGKLWLSGGEDAGPGVSKEAPERAMLMDMRRARPFPVFFFLAMPLVSYRPLAHDNLSNPASRDAGAIRALERLSRHPPPERPDLAARSARVCFLGCAAHCAARHNSSVPVSDTWNSSSRLRERPAPLRRHIGRTQPSDPPIATER